MSFFSHHAVPTNRQGRNLLIPCNVSFFLEDFKVEKLMTPLLTIVVLFALVFVVAFTGYAVAWLLLINAGNRLTLRQHERRLNDLII
jgi:hypothetical protein